MKTNSNNHSQNEKSEKEIKFDEIKAELGLEDEGIRMIAKRKNEVRQAAILTLESEDGEKINFLIEEVKKRDKVRLLKFEEIMGEKNTLAKTIYQEYGENKEMFDEFVEIAKTFGGNAEIEELFKARIIYGKDKEMFDKFVEVIMHHNRAIRPIYYTDAQSVYDENDPMFELFLRPSNTSKQSNGVIELVRASIVCDKDIGMLSQFVEVAKEQGYWVMGALREASPVYGKDERLFSKFAEVAKEQGATAVKALTEVRSIYVDNMEKFIKVKDLIQEIAKESGDDAVQALNAAKSVYGGDMNKFEQVKISIQEVAKEQGDSAVYALTNARSVYGNDMTKFLKVKNLIQEVAKEQGGTAVYALAEARSVYGNDMTKFLKVKNLIQEVAKEQGGTAVYALAEARSVYGNDMTKFLKVKNLIQEVAKKRDRDAVNALAKAKTAYGDNIEMFNTFVEVAKEKGDYAVNALAKAKTAYGDNMEMFNTFAEIAKKKGGVYTLDALVELENLYQSSPDRLKTLELIISDITSRLGKDVIKTLVKYKDLYGNDVTKLQKAAKYAESTKIFEKNVLAKYIEIFEQKGEEKANEYLASLSSKAKGLIGSEIPGNHRELPEYQYLVRYVFPDGNYSNYEKNLGCGDKLEHLNKYEFDRTGYPVVLTGLLGYKIKEGSKSDQQLIGTYTERLNKIRRFVASRGPNNDALQKTFDEKIKQIFTKKAWPEFREMADLTSKEKMLCLFLGEAIRRKQKGQSSEPDANICDLIVEYKYAFHEDLEAYVARSADGVKAYKDKESQDYMLLAELSVIYGENVKHVLKHNIFEELENSANYDQIVEIFSEKIGGSNEDKDLTPKQWKRIDNTFSNARIPAVKRSEILYKQVYGIFSSNIDFESNEEKQGFEDKLKDLFSELTSDLSVEKFRELLPRFYKLRTLYRSGINAKLTELFTYDINTIFEELAKYEENVEKEKQSKKSSKKRNIRGYFTKTAETANARMGAYLCIAGDTKMWENKNYFEMVLTDEETNKCVGVVMLLAIKGKDGEKYLWFGPNPFESFLDVVSSQACYQYLYDNTCEFAEQNNFAGVVVPSKNEQILGQCTNRGGDFPGFIKDSRLRDKKDGLMIVDFDKKHALGGGYGYEEGALIWKRGK
jgi:ACT domain-containing protein